MNIDTLTIAEISQLISQKIISCEELAKEHLYRIQKINPSLNAIVQMRSESDILLDARMNDKINDQSNQLLFGIPITVKNGFKVKGFFCDLGYKGYHHQLATEDATIVNRLRQQGVNILGMTNAAELCLTFETDNLLYGRTNNPHNLLHSAGGSSGGEAAIIAAGGSLLGIGSDGSGSIRQPAHATGIVGIKPTQHLVPRTGSIPSDGGGFFSYLGTYGLLARFIDDLMFTLPIVAGSDYIDPHCTVSTDIKRPVDLKKIKIGFYLNNHIIPPDADTIHAITSMLQKLAPVVCDIEENSPSILSEIFRLHWETFVYGGDGGQWLWDLQKNCNQQPFSATTYEFLQYASTCRFTVTELQNRMVEIDHFRLNLYQSFKNYDVIISPVARTAALPHGQSMKNIKDFSYTMTYNLMGWPAVSVNCGWSRDKLPIGVQVVAKPWCDWIALTVAKEIERIAGRWKPAPLI